MLIDPVRLGVQARALSHSWCSSGPDRRTGGPLLDYCEADVSKSRVGGNSVCVIFVVVSAEAEDEESYK